MGQIKIEMRPLQALHPYENNPRYNEDAIESVAKSIREYGFKVPMVITADGEIVCWHTRYKAAASLGLEEVPCVIADDLTPEQIRAFRLADNKVSDLSIWDNKKLLIELDEIDGDLFTGFTESEIFGSDLSELDMCGALEENESGVTYEIKIQTGDADVVERIVREYGVESG